MLNVCHFKCLETKKLFLFLDILVTETILYVVKVIRVFEGTLMDIINI